EHLADNRCQGLRREASELKQKFNEAFWLEDLGIFAMALDGRKCPARVISSNAGQVLWSGIADPDKARRTADRLLQPDAFNGWGIRTLSSRERRYNPIGYHLGTVWPHDNGLIAAGFRRYGLLDAMQRVARGLLDAASFFDLYRLPEVFSGFSREAFDVPVTYPVACHPQAWAAGCMPYLTALMLGLEPDALQGRLHIAQPWLPKWIHRLDVRNLAIGKACVALRYERQGDHVRCEVAEIQGDLHVDLADPDL
ncbi:MAG: amylo-alpha-1,6-glucosidase, partial [Cyanobacteria bacterium REEB65]|nr:amylo-alpha-1,6-glucosidase [Cyanobacteria bacterium REEB65]